MRAWRGPQKIVHVLQEGRIYELDTGQKCHFEQLEPHQSGALEFVTASMDGGDMFCCWIRSRNMPLMLSMMTCPDLPIKLNNYFRKHRMCPCLHASVIGWILDCVERRARGSRIHYQRFHYSFSGNDDEMSDAVLPIPSIPPDADHVETEVPIPASNILISPTNYVTQL